MQIMIVVMGVMMMIVRLQMWLLLLLLLLVQVSVHFHLKFIVFGQTSAQKFRASGGVIQGAQVVHFDV